MKNSSSAAAANESVPTMAAGKAPSPHAMPTPRPAKMNIMSRGSRMVVRNRTMDRPPARPMPAAMESPIASMSIEVITAPRGMPWTNDRE